MLPVITAALFNFHYEGGGQLLEGGSNCAPILLVSNLNSPVSEQLIKSPREWVAELGFEPNCLLINDAVLPQNKNFLVTFTKLSKITIESKNVKNSMYLK